MHPIFSSSIISIFFFNDAPTTETYTLSLHDALPIFARPRQLTDRHERLEGACRRSIAVSAASHGAGSGRDRKSTRLNSSHANISYAVFCLKKKTNIYACAKLTPSLEG